MRTLTFGLLIFLLPGMWAAAQPAVQRATQPAAQSADQPAAQPRPIDKNKVMDYFQNQQFEEAVAYLAPALAADSSDLTLLGYAGYAYYMNDHSDEAYGCFQRMLGVDSNNVTALHYLLLIRINEDPGEAIGYGARLLQLQPGRAVWWRIMGELSARRQHPDSALSYYNQAYVMAPGDVKTIAGLVDLLIEDRNFTRPDSILDLALARDSLNNTLLRLKVRSSYQGQHYAEVLVPGERLLRSDQTAVQSLTWLSLAYYNLKQYPDCIRVCEGMLADGMDIESVYYYEARAWTKLRQYEKSDSLLRIALKKAIAPTAEWYYDNLGSNEEDLRHYKAALANYDTAYYLFRDPRVLYTCGRICEVDLKDMAMARKYYRHYLAVAKPTSKDEIQAYYYVRKVWGKKEGK
jgi:tetratricopeptide (TPR) repeat protein